MRLLLSILFALYCSTSFSQKDDLNERVETEPEVVRPKALDMLDQALDASDRAAAYHLLGLCDYYANTADKGEAYFLKENEILNQQLPHHFDRKADNLLKLSSAYYDQGKLVLADSVLAISRSYFPKLKNNDSLKVDILLNTGWIAREQGKHKDALDYYLDALQLAESNQDESRMADAYSKIAVVYHVMHDFSTAKSYYDQALFLYQKNGQRRKEARLYNNYGLLYQYQSQSTKAIEYFEKSIQFCEEEGNLRGVAIANENMGLVCFEDIENNTLALKRYNKSLAIWRSLNDIYGQAQTLAYKIDVYLDQHKYTMAIDTAKLALELCEKAGSGDVKLQTLKQISKAYEGTQKYEDAFQFLKAHTQLKDSLQSINDFEEIKLMGLRYEMQKAHVQDSLNMVIVHNQKEAEIQSEYEFQRFFTLLLSIGFIALILILFLLIRGRRQRLESSKIIENANKELKTKNHEIIASITYAKNIQNSILPAAAEINALFPENFIFYVPKDIIAGDFYWVSEVIQNGKKIRFAAVADCTGHGVPGAMVSIVCSNALNKVVREMGITNPADILEKVSDIVVQNFDQGQHQINDGMDICLLAITEIDDSTFEVVYAGANNPLWYIPKSSSELAVIKPTKRPVGRFENIVPFEDHTITLKKDDLLFLFSDGYADQFGGPKGKKFKYRTLMNLFTTHQHKPLNEQKKVYTEVLNNWMADMEQVDDICLMGIRL